MIADLLVEHWHACGDAVVDEDEAGYVDGDVAVGQPAFGTTVPFNLLGMFDDVGSPRPPMPMTALASRTWELSAVLSVA